MPEKPADLNFWFDPICQFAWMTSTWVRQVQAARDYRVNWRFISLRLINEDVDYSARFPRVLREGAHRGAADAAGRGRRAREARRRRRRAAYYASCGAHIFEREPWESTQERTDTLGTRRHVRSILAGADLPIEFADGRGRHRSRRADPHGDATRRSP